MNATSTHLLIGLVSMSVGFTACTASCSGPAAPVSLLSDSADTAGPAQDVPADTGSGAGSGTDTEVQVPDSATAGDALGAVDAKVDVPDAATAATDALCVANLPEPGQPCPVKGQVRCTNLSASGDHVNSICIRGASAN